MLKKSLRLRAAEVEEVLKAGRSIRSAHMQIKLLGAPGVSSGPLRSAAVVAKAVARKANERNNLRRAIYRAIAAAPSPTANSLQGKALFFLRLIPKENPSAVIKEEVVFLLSQAGQAKIR